MATTIEELAINYTSTGDDAVISSAKNIQATMNQTAIEAGHITDATRQMTLTQMEAIKLNDEMIAGQKEHGLSLGRVSRSMEMFAARTLGANEQIALLGTAFAHLEFGEEAVVGVLAGVAAGIFIWRAWTEEINKGKKELEAAQKTLDEMAKSEKAKFSGADAVAAGKLELEELNRQIAEQVIKVKQVQDQSVSRMGAVGVIGIGDIESMGVRNRLLDLQAQREKLTQGIAAGTIVMDRQTHAEEQARIAEENKLAVERLAVVQLREKTKAEDDSRLNLAILTANQKADTEVLKHSTETRRLVREEMNRTTEAMRNATIAEIHDTEQHRLRVSLNAIEYEGTKKLLDIRIKRTEAMNDPQDTLRARMIAIEAEYQLAVLEAGKELTQREVVAKMQIALKNKTAETEDAIDIDTAAKRKKLQENLLQTMQSGFTSLFDGILTGGINSFKKLFDEIKDMFLKLIAELAAKQLAKSLLPAVTSVAATVLGLSLSTVPTLTTGATGALNSLQAANPVNLQLTVIGKDDPTAQRQILELISRAQRRGSTAG